MEREIEYKDKKLTIKEIKYIDMIEMQSSGIAQGEITKKLLMLSSGLTEEEVNSLSLSDGLRIQKVVNEVNGFDNFREPMTESI